MYPSLEKNIEFYKLENTFLIHVTNGSTFSNRSWN